MKALADDPPAAAPEQSNFVETTEQDRVTAAVARDRAKPMHTLYKATLGVMYDRCLHADRVIVPTRAMEDVIAEFKR